MANIGDPIVQTIPTVGASGTQYATDIDAFLAEVGVRLAAKVPRASLAAGALDLANNPLQNAQYVSLFASGVLPTTPSGSLQQFGGDLYWVTGSGQAQITSGNALNAASVGAITGDYGGANPAQFRFVAADLEYYAYTSFAGGTWAKVWANGFDLAAGATSVNRVRMLYGGAGSYSLTMPTALPAATKYVQISNTGQLTANGIVNPDRTIPMTMAGAQGAISAAAGTGLVTITAAGTAYIPLIGAVSNQEQLQSIKLFYNESAGGTASVVTLGKTSTTAVTAGFSAIAGATGTLNNNGVSNSIVLTPTTPAILQSGDTYWLKIVGGTVATTDLYSAVISISVP